MNKIQVEDLTKPPSIEEMVKATANTVFIYTARLGLMQGMNPKDVVRAIMSSAEMMAEYALILNKITDEEIVGAREEAISFAKQRCEELKQQGFFDLVKRIADNIGQVKEKKDD